MAETYCGKTCAECAQRETMNCPGCKSGPGRQIGGDCELAGCVRTKSHETCHTCSQNNYCGMFRSCDRMPDDRRRRMEAEEQRKAAIARRAPVLGKWLWVLFWLIIPSELGGLMTQDAVAEMLPALYIPGQILSAAVLVAYGVILVILASEEEQYRTAGICSLVAGAGGMLVAVISGTGETPGWTLLISIPAAVVALVGEYHEYMAHSAVLAGVDHALSEKWDRLWKWYIGLFAGVFGSIVVMLIIPLLGALISLASSIGIIVVSITKLVYLYRTAQIFRAYSDQLS